MTVSLALQRARALAAIDEAAGEARLRYITEVPGQQAVYMVKLAEARAYISAGYTGQPGPHLVAVAAATSRTAQAVADEVATIAAVWEQQISPAIEAARLAGKAAVLAAQDVDASRNATLQALQAL